MIDTKISSELLFSKTVVIHALSSEVWQALTNPELMKQWMAEEEITIITHWKVGAPILIKGEGHWVYFENKGIVLQYEPEKVLQYSHLSSLSKLPDTAENYSLIKFNLVPTENQTTLTLSLGNFPTESIYKHLAFYWNITLNLLKEFIEKP
ncbi:MAG: SRPBCC domain-containing protein [Bacteroidota bacterium]